MWHLQYFKWLMGIWTLLILNSYEYQGRNSEELEGKNRDGGRVGKNYKNFFPSFSRVHSNRTSLPRSRLWSTSRSQNLTCSIINQSLIHHYPLICSGRRATALHNSRRYFSHRIQHERCPLELFELVDLERINASSHSIPSLHLIIKYGNKKFWWGTSTLEQTKHSLEQIKFLIPLQSKVHAKISVMGLPWWRSGWESACQRRGHGFEPWSGRVPHAAERLGPWATITEPARLEPVLRNKRGRDSERPAHRDEEWPPLATTRESPHTETKTQHSQK